MNLNRAIAAVAKGAFKTTALFVPLAAAGVGMTAKAAVNSTGSHTPRKRQNKTQPTVEWTDTTGKRHKRHKVTKGYVTTDGMVILFAER